MTVGSAKRDQNHDQNITCLLTCSDAPNVGRHITQKQKELRTVTLTEQTGQPQQLAGDRALATPLCNGRKTVVGTSTLLSVLGTADTEGRNANFRTLIAVQYLVTSCCSGLSLVCAVLCRREQRDDRNICRDQNNTTRPKLERNSEKWYRQ